MTPATGFLLFLALTLVLLAGVVATGKRKRRPLHLTLVFFALLSLATTIAFAEALGELYDLESAGAITPIHLTLAKLTTLAYLLPIATGIWTLRRPKALRWHRRCAYLVLAATLLTAATGTWMLLAAEPLPAAALEAALPGGS